jgi:ferric-dicitrate binding protein FerR (iron transport regulator)
MASQNAIASEFACSCDSLIVLIGSARFQGDVPDGVVALGDLPQALARLADPETHGARAAFERIKALTADGTARRRLAHRHQRRAGERHHRGAGASAWALAGCACAVLGIFAL